jgi:hypothetical protein
MERDMTKTGGTKTVGWHATLSMSDNGHRYSVEITEPQFKVLLRLFVNLDAMARLGHDDRMVFKGLIKTLFQLKKTKGLTV